MSDQPTTIQSLDAATFAARIADLYPRGWCSDDAKQTGNMYALLVSFGGGLSFVQSAVQYALNAQRLQTETAPELDLASIDFFNTALPRPAGMSDANFATLIIDTLFHPAATRSALQNALYTLTGYEARMLEPWAPGDTGGWGTQVSYWNADSAATPARWGNGGIRYQGYIETAPPAIPAIGPNNPVLTWGTAYWDVPGYFFGIIQSAPEDAVNALVNRLRAYGTIVWLKLVAPSAPAVVAPGMVPVPSAIATSPNTVMVSWQAPAIGTQPITYTVLYQQAGSIPWLAGPVVAANSALVSNLQPDTVYNFEVQARNPAGFSVSSFTTATTLLVPPSPATGLQATQVQANAVTLVWQPPLAGTPPFTYSVNYRVTGTVPWNNILVGQGALTVTVINLQQATQYDFEVVTTNL